MSEFVDIKPRILFESHKDDMLNVAAMMTLLANASEKQMILKVEEGTLDIGSLAYLEVAGRVVPGLISLLRVIIGEPEDVESAIIARSNEILDKYDPDFDGDIAADVERFIKGQEGQ